MWVKQVLKIKRTKQINKQGIEAQLQERLISYDYLGPMFSVFLGRCVEDVYFIMFGGEFCLLWYSTSVEIV